MGPGYPRAGVPWGLNQTIKYNPIKGRKYYTQSGGLALLAIMKNEWYKFFQNSHAGSPLKIKTNEKRRACLAICNFIDK